MVDDAFARDALQRCVLFSRLDPAGIEACLAHLRIRRYRRNETIFHQGDPGGALHVIARGSVKVLLASPEGGPPAILSTLRAGQFFGEIALLDGEPHSATVVAMEETEALVLDRADFDALLDTQPGFGRAMLAGLAKGFRRLTDHVEALVFLELPARLALRIAVLAEDVRDPGLPAGTEVRLDWPYTQSELAGMVGGSRESVNRLLADFVARGLVRFEHDTLVVPDPARLTAEARR
jgi:CRP-like cAMP-binding protein